jgi:hypothetical protein
MSCIFWLFEQDYLTGDYLPMDEFISCCNSHDICYETCGHDRDECDLRFKKCLYAHCRARKESMSQLKFKGKQCSESCEKHDLQILYNFIVL